MYDLDIMEGVKFEDIEDWIDPDPDPVEIRS